MADAKKQDIGSGSVKKLMLRLAVFLAEPVSDITAAAVTTVTFFTFFRKLLRDKEE